MPGSARTRALGMLVAVLGAAVLADSAAARSDVSPTLEISSIIPAVADRGELVTITGQGLAASGLAVTVGGEPVTLEERRSTRATFRVPLLTPAGEVEVIARKPGGRQARIALTVRFDGRSTPILDTTGRVSSTIGRTGGSLASGGLTLTIPPGALSSDESITLTPLTDLLGSPLAGTVIGGAKLEPEGLRFLRPAQLTFELPAGTTAAQLVGFGSEGDGSELHLQPRTVSGASVSLELWHFSTAGASSGAGSAAAAVASRVPSSAETAALQRIALAESACAAEQAGGTVGGPACANQLNEIGSALSDWYRASVSPGLRLALGAPSFEVEAALAEWLFWQQETEARLSNLLGPCGPMQLNCNDAHAHATAAVVDMAERRLGNCTGTSLASQFRDVARVADFADAGAIDLPGAGLPADMLHACAHLEIEVTEFPAIAALFHANTLRGRVTVRVRSGPDRTDVPLMLTIGGSAVATAADGTFQTTLTPGEAGLPLNVELRAEANDPDLQTANFTAIRSLTKPTRARLKLIAQSPTAVAAGGTVAFLVQVAGDGMSGVTVTLSVAGPGSVSPSPVTMNAGGEATSVYTAPALTAVPDANVTAALPDGTSAMIPISIAPLVTVGVSPTSATVAAGGTQNFTASVTGSFLGVTWTATGGAIVTTGSTTARYEAGSTPGTFSVTATSIADTTKSATATITITSATSARVRVLYRTAQASASAQLDQGGIHDNKNFAEEPPLAFGSVSHLAGVLGASASHFSRLLGTSATLDADGNMSFSVSEEFTSAFSSFSVGFRVENAPLKYGVVANTTHTGIANCATDIILQNAETGALIVNSGTSPANVSRQGTLSPGTYTFVVGGGCRTSGNGGASFSFFVEP